MAETRTCPECGAALADDAPLGLCPKCLLFQAQPTATGPTPRYTGPFVAPEPAELSPLFPQLEVLEMLGRGGMGAVYKCRQPHLDRLVALKILPPESGQDPTFAERFAREAKTLAKLNHPNIVGVHDYGNAGGYYYFLMEYVDGANLRQIIRGGQLQPAEALRIVPQICDALQFAHDEGVVHRDIKPENILVDKRGRVKIADFGLAKLVGASAVESGLTGTMQVMGTLYYMAPEQMERPKDVDHRADIYSLGVVLYELLTGQLPVGNFPRPSQKVQVDVRLDEVVLRALRHEPQQRYQQASEVKTEVEAISGGGVVRAAKPASRDRAESPPWDAAAARQRLRVPAIAMIVVGGLQSLVLLTGIMLFLIGGIYSMMTGMHWPAGGHALHGTGAAQFPLLVSLGGPELLLLLGSNILGPLLLIGGIQMYRAQSYPLVIVAAIAALLPCGPLFLLSLPVGIWVLVTLHRREVMAAFEAPPTVQPEAAPTSAHRVSAPEAVPSPAESLPIEKVRSRLRGPAGGLLVVGMLTVLLAATMILWSAWQLSRHASIPSEPQKTERGGMTMTVTPDRSQLPNLGLVITLLVTQVLALASGMMTLLAVLAMRRTEHYGLAVLGSALPLVPLSPAWVLGFPLGMWALMSLRRLGIREAFEQSTGDEESGLPDEDQQAAWLRDWLAGPAAWIMLASLLGAATTFLPWVYVNTFGIGSSQAGFDLWQGIASGCAFVCAFLALVAIENTRPIGLLRAAAAAAAGAIVLYCTISLLIEAGTPPRATTSATGDVEAMGVLADFFKDFMVSNIEVKLQTGPYLALSFGIVLLLLCLWQVAAVLGASGGGRAPAGSVELAEEA